MIHKLFPTLLLSLALSLPLATAIPPASAGTSNSDPQLIQAVTAALDIPPDICSPRILHVALVENYSLLDWQCGEGGGEMLLFREANHWKVISGDGGAYQSRDLIRLGVPSQSATQLVQQLQSQWPKQK